MNDIPNDPATPEISPDGPIADAFDLFTAAQLRMPAIPWNLVPKVVALDEWLFGTRDEKTSPYALESFVDEVKSGDVAEYVLFGHAGHGVNSWAMHYYLVSGSLALFVQYAYGGAYMDNDSAAISINQALLEAEALLIATDEAAEKGKLGPGERLLVIDSDLHDPGYQVLGPKPSEFVVTPDAVLAAQEFLAR